MRQSMRWPTKSAGKLAAITGKLRITPRWRRASSRNSPPEAGNEPEGASASATSESPEPPRLRDLLSRERISTDLTASSKKSLLEQLAGQLRADHPELDERAVFQTLLRRENLGSTGIGHGVALPHGRTADLDQPLGAFARLAQPADFDALDDQPVTLVFALLVPDEENEQHLQLLARLARMFDDADFRQRLLQAPEDELFDLLVAKDEEITDQ